MRRTIAVIEYIFNDDSQRFRQLGVNPSTRIQDSWISSQGFNAVFNVVHLVLTQVPTDKMSVMTAVSMMPSSTVYSIKAAPLSSSVKRLVRFKSFVIEVPFVELSVSLFSRETFNRARCEHASAVPVPWQRVVMAHALNRKLFSDLV